MVQIEINRINIKGSIIYANNLTLPTTKTFEMKRQSHQEIISTEARGYGVMLTKRRWLKIAYKIVLPRGLIFAIF